MKTNVTLIGFMGMYTLLAILWLFLIYREIDHGPESNAHAVETGPAPVAAD